MYQNSILLVFLSLSWIHFSLGFPRRDASVQTSVVTAHGSCSGYTNRCCTGPLCSVQNGDGLCYCDVNCHTRNECCSDVGCPRPRTCAAANLSPGCCRGWGNACQAHMCYCDKLCWWLGDCCSDVTSEPHCSSSLQKTRRYQDYLQQHLAYMNHKAPYTDRANINEDERAFLQDLIAKLEYESG